MSRSTVLQRVIKMIQNFFFNGPDQPKWAKRMERMIMRVEEKLAELEAAQAAQAAAISASLDGITGDLQAQSDEIAALKQAVIDAGSNPGELSPDLIARFDALKGALDGVVQRAAEIDAALPNAPAPQPGPTPEPEPEAPVAEEPAPEVPAEPAAE